jgi:hypothetical protein
LAPVDEEEALEEDELHEEEEVEAEMLNGCDWARTEVREVAFLMKSTRCQIIDEDVSS